VVARKVKCRLYVKFGGNLANQSLGRGASKERKRATSRTALGIVNSGEHAGGHGIEWLRR
jgi:hypothetical protein